MCVLMFHIVVLEVMTPCCLVHGYHIFRGRHCHNLQSRSDCKFTVKMVIVMYVKTFEYLQDTTWLNFKLWNYTSDTNCKNIRQRVFFLFAFCFQKMWHYLLYQSSKLLGCAQPYPDQCSGINVNKLWKKQSNYFRIVNFTLFLVII